MTIQTTYTNARENLKALLDEVVDSRETVIIQRRGSADVALVAADELRSLLETAHLFRSPANAERLTRALKRARQSRGKATTIEKLRKDIALDEK